MIVIADTSGIIAASDRKSDDSLGCRTVLQEAGTVIISPLVLAEVDHMAKVRFGPPARAEIISFLLAQVRRLRFQVPQIDGEILDTAHSVQQRYKGLDLDLADAVNTALAAEYRTDTVLTLDRRDFRAVRPLTPHSSFRLLPDDW
ncbi:PIN domain-containing protein [Streptomyces sp. WAC 00631]|uniref:PIN domain-containing protein n=1 Tax=unclassified Streptomyces TaxID=2593676 RepID=UPI000F79FB80|nr:MULTISPECIES: PIN domain-containing protein [unclassified Streptomyces]MCC5036139.1 PIN domain-containing protein [Streptomyces sp. WAC 00631]MCC9738835.1 PIN domain-containing protein [Streptomyces sp. MNU89]